MNNYFTVLISYLLYVLIFVGITLIYNKDIEKAIVKVLIRNRLVAKKREVMGPSPIMMYFDNITYITFPKWFDGKKFICITVAIIILVFLILFKNMPLNKSIFISLIIGLLPYLFLKIKIENIRRKSSFEGENLIGNFLSQYRLSKFNIFETMEKVVENSKNTKITNRLMTKLMMELRITNNPDKISKACDNFAYAINTNWGRMLSHNIGIAAENGINISSGIEDILIQLREARTLTEERKRMNGEAVRMVVYLVPLLYIGTIVLSIYTMGMTFREFLTNQFFSEEGFLLFLAICFLMLINVVIIESINNQRFDY